MNSITKQPLGYTYVEFDILRETPALQLAVVHHRGAKP